MEFPHEEMGLRIRALRTERGLTREQLAEKADISVQFLADLEKGRKSMTVATLRRLSSALLVTTDEIVIGAESAPGRREDALDSLCSSLTARQRTEAEKILRVFIEALRQEGIE